MRNLGKSTRNQLLAFFLLCALNVGEILARLDFEPFYTAIDKIFLILSRPLD